MSALPNPFIPPGEWLSGEQDFYFQLTIKINFVLRSIPLTVDDCNSTSVFCNNNTTEFCNSDNVVSLIVAVQQPLFADSFESGSTSAWSGGSLGSPTVAGFPLPVQHGKYAVNLISSAGHGAQLGSNSWSWGVTTVYARTYLYINALPASVGLGFRVLSLYGRGSGGSLIAGIMLSSSGSGAPSLNLYNFVTSAQVGSAFAVTDLAWLCVEIKAVISASIGILEMRVNTVIEASGSSLNTGTRAVDLLYIEADSASTIPSASLYFDSVVALSTGYPGF